VSEKPLPLFESLAAVFVVAVVSLLTAFPSVKPPEARISKDVVLAEQLVQLRTAVERYLASEAAIATSGEKFEAELAATYLVEIPENPINHRSTIRVMAAGYPTPSANGTAGWIYVPADRSIYPDLPGTDGSGKTYLSY
jgi:hypothetical protein